MFKVGDKVVSIKYGIGVVIGISTPEDLMDYSAVLVRFSPTHETTFTINGIFEPRRAGLGDRDIRLATPLEELL